MTARKSLEQWSKQKEIECLSFAEIDSTNTFAKSLPWDLRPRVVVADHQTHGRGRGSNNWQDQGLGTQLLSSWVLELRHAPQPITTPRVGFALWCAFKRTWPEGQWSLKAPNDLLLNGKKVAGLLLEVISQGDVHRLIVGLGLNISSHPDTIKDAGHVSQTDPQAFERLDAFLDHWWNELNDSLADFIHSELPVNICAGLCEALNKNPNLTDIYTKVFSDGSLQTSDKKIDWMKI